jgi:hypothetical protein
MVADLAPPLPAGQPVLRLNRTLQITPTEASLRGLPGRRSQPCTSPTAAHQPLGHLLQAAKHVIMADWLTLEVVYPSAYPAGNPTKRQIAKEALIGAAPYKAEATKGLADK